MLWLIVMIAVMVWIIKDHRAVMIELRKTRAYARSVENDSQDGIIVLGTSRKSTV
jgi:hypothetical protein